MPARETRYHADDLIRRLQQRLLEQGYQCGEADDRFGPKTRAALMQFQDDAGLLVDGIAGPVTLAALGVERTRRSDILERITPGRIRKLFPYTRPPAIARNLPHIRAGLAAFDLTDKPMALMALSTIRAECEPFEPLNEQPSRYSCSSGRDDFDLYDHRCDLGNLGAPDGWRFRGRGFVQLTGRANYRRVGRLIGLGDRLEEDPDMAAEGETAGQILGAFLATRERAIREALMERDLRRARRLVNGGAHGLERFIDCFERGDRLFDDAPACERVDGI
ncbi:MAG: peptidoglycan-binding protein [Geminicoccaceae bacterium]|nr:peptidoglycan-binding protein [Geminicoccaceae bacterium]